MARLSPRPNACINATSATSATRIAPSTSFLHAENIVVVTPSCDAHFCDVELRRTELQPTVIGPMPLPVPRTPRRPVTVSLIGSHRMVCYSRLPDAPEASGGIKKHQEQA